MGKKKERERTERPAYILSADEPGLAHDVQSFYLLILYLITGNTFSLSLYYDNEDIYITKIRQHKQMQLTVLLGHSPRTL